jgi:uncharacterized membrane protein
MGSPRSTGPGALLVILMLWLALCAACGSDVDTACATSDLTYETFGAPFVTTWCRGCHSREQDPLMRQHAPEGVDFDTRADVVRFTDAIRERAGTGRTMPPAGGPSSEERELLVEWLGCNAPP